MKIRKQIYTFIAAVTMILSFIGCTPDSYSLGDSGIKAEDLQEGLAFTVTQDASNSNIVYLKSLLDGYNAVWTHTGIGLGHSTGSEVELDVAFAGVYPIVFGVETKGGTIYSDTTYVTIDKFCADFVSGDEWNYLAGGAGKSKTWIPDNGNYGCKQGFYTCFDPLATIDVMTHDEGKNNWYALGYTWWEPGNSEVGVTDEDLAQEMTFSLEGSATISVKDANGNITTGSYVFSPDKHSLDADGVEFAHGAWANGKSKSFSSDFYIFHLSENQLMIANKRDPVLSGEGEAWFVWNFVSKEYAENYSAPVAEEPVLPDGWNSAVSTQTNKTVTWVLSADSPYDWFTLNGTRKNSYASVSDYPAFESPLSNLGEKIQLKMNSEKSTYELTNDGSEVASGTYTLSDKGVYTFSNGLGSICVGGDWINLAADKDNQLRIMTYDTNSATGKVNNLWLGSKQYDNAGNMYQYLGYHFVAITYGDEIPYDACLSFYEPDWVTQQSETVDAKKEGQYTLTINGSSSSPYGIYLDVLNVLAEHPNATLTLDDVKVDGTALTGYDWSYTGFNKDEKTGAQLTGDKVTTARIYLLNPWDGTSPFAADNSVFNFSSSITVTFTLAFND